MFKNIKDNIDREEIVELIEYSVFPDSDRMEEALRQYRTNDALQLYGIESEGEFVAIIGFERNERNELTIRHLAVRPDCRGAGFGRGLILETIALMNPSKVAAETDVEAVDFYRAIGFEIESLGERHPGVERFLCTYDAAGE